VVHPDILMDLFAAVRCISDVKRLALAAVVAAFTAVPGAAAGAACSPLNCAPSQLSLADGSLLALRAGGIDANVRVLDMRTGKTRWWLPAGVFGGDILVHKDGTLLTWFDAATGARVASTVAALRGSYALVGASPDGRRAVLARTQTRRTTFVVVSQDGGQRQAVLGGNTWSFDSLSGDRLFLIHARRKGYEVRLYHLATDRLDPEPLKDPGESALIQGIAWQRVASPDGRYLLTLYLSGEGRAMVHELDVRAGTARCIDLPGTGDFSAATSYALALSKDARTLWAVSSGYGRVATIDVGAHRLRSQFSFTAGPRNGVAGVAALSPDGKRIAVSDAQHVWLVDPARKYVARPLTHVAIAVGFSADGKKLWVVGERSRVSSLQVRA
jgi:hypothetical protein